MAQEGAPPWERGCRGDGAAYALGALDPYEAENFRRHLTGCIVCRDELSAYTEVTDALGMAVVEHAMPRGVRDRILREFRAEGQAALPDTQRRRPRSSRHPRFTTRPRLAIGLIAAVIFVAIGAVTLAPHGPRAPRVIQARVLGVAGSAQLLLAGVRAQLIVSHLPAPPRGRIYEVWVEREGHAPSPQALFTVSAFGGADIAIPDHLNGVSTIMVTQERAGGSLVPTSTPVIVASLS